MNEAARLGADDEAGRLAALRRYNILDTEPEEEFDEIVALIRSIFNISSAAINLIDFDRQWSKAAANASSNRCASQNNCPRSEAFCDYTIRSQEATMIEDASLDPRFADNRFVTGPLGVRSYLGVPLTTPDGYNIGALCVFGTEPRSFTSADKEVLSNFAKVVMSQMELRLTARVDGLTGVLTRKAFVTRLDRVVAEDTGDPTSLVLLDLDHFKSINDRFGHPAGDAVLTHVAAAMSGLVKKPDSIGRVGGEEFGILLHGADLVAAQGLAARLRERLAQLSVPGLPDERVTVSAGVAERSRGETRQAWFERADRALYAAKHNGRDQAVAAAPLEVK
ncbi:sensor domain-containing diguanylate cyclase [Paracoccus sp. Z118]|uniref:sensor domain-containing diguanylate cyclase n=1 Tax=Paracoccus sp. Z118 TaxID=2851017 RepID=UPI001C2BAA12|nr:sensor domain-containing diguanylate cyclase [Paracoccus sp. Z118]MBV0892861.1 sensor domain-containing diguanylate cyclase [Paracoccus sp. Z118]